MSNEIKKRKNKQKQNQQQNDDYKKLTKDEESIAKYLKFNCSTKKANLMGMKVDYFIGSKAVDCLMNSKWATGIKNTQILFQNRESCKQFLQELLNKELFHRAVKVYKEQQVESPGSTTTPENTPKPRKRKNAEQQQQQQSINDDKTDKSKRKFKLEMHDNQLFFDSAEPYVWIYDPPTAKSLIVGSLLVIGAIGICLFPLWPSIVREGVYYLSLVGAGFLGFILSLAVLKYILFALIWVVTLGGIHFWLLPNLTEDVGFFESFVPFYKIKNTSSNEKKESNKKSDEANEKKKAEEFNKLPLDEQLMKKFDENIEQSEEINDENEEIEDDIVDDDYDVIEKDIDLKNN